jgi:predicted DNA-binding transcriptional regulator YafY
MTENRQKIKLIKLYELLRKETDEDHPISRVELCRRLNEMNISSNVRTLSEDIKVLTDNGFEIESFLKDKEKYFYVPEHELTIPEIKILIDALQAATFVTEKKTAELVEKVAALGGSHKAELLKENMICFNTRKHTNEAILYTVDGIEDAIIRRKKIAFNYFHLNEKAERVYVTTGTGEKKRYYVEPVALIFNEDNYYLMAYSSKHPDSTASYRIDRIDHLEVVEESVMSEATIAKIDGVAEFTEQAFKMYGGDLEDVVLQFDRSLVDPVFDKFGEDTPMMKVNDTTCAATVHVQISPTFFGWLAQFGNRMKILTPDTVVEQYKKHIGTIMNTDA